MRNAILKTTLAALVLSSPLAATEAMAKYKVKEIKAHFVTGAYENPVTMIMEKKGSSWNWVNQSAQFNPRIKVSFKANRKSEAWIRLDKKDTLWKTPLNYKAKSHKELVTVKINKHHLKSQTSKAASLCNTYGGSKQVVRDIGIPSQFVVSRPDRQGLDYKVKNLQMPVKVACKPVNSSAGNSHGPILAALKLYSIPAKPKCGQPVTMVAQFQTHNQGKINFLYHRSDGKKQNASVVTTKVGKSYMGQWKKTYTFNESVNRKYAVLVKDQNKSTQWVPLKVTCTKTSTGGKAS